MKKLMILAVSALALVLPAPGVASNDGLSPGDDCSDNPNAIGQPVNDRNGGGEPNAVDHGRPGDVFGSPVAGPASDFNAADLAQGFPSEQAVLVTDGAQGQERSGLRCEAAGR